MRVPAILLILLCATPAGSAFGLVGGGGVWHASESQRARHVCSRAHPQQGADSGLASCRGGFAFTSRRKNRPTGTALFGKQKLTEEEMEERKEQLRVLLSASEEETDKLVCQNPTVLNFRDINESHAPKLKVLQERLGISEKDAGRLCLSRCRLLSTSLATLEKKIIWLQARLNINKTQMRRIVGRNHNVLVLSIDDNLEPTIDNIQSYLELSDKDLTKLIAREPKVLQYNMSAENIKQQISLLQELLGLPEGDVGGLRKYIKRAPELLFWSEERMKEVQQWMEHRLGLGDAKIAQMCRNHPDLLSWKISSLEKKADLIQSDLSLNDDELNKLVSQFPVILAYCPEKNLRPKLLYLQTRFELDDNALKDLVLKAPQLFGYPTGNIEEKLQFYSKFVGKREAKRLVIKSTNLLNQSLKKLKSRLEEVEKSGTRVRWNETLIQRLARRTPDQWERYKLGDAPRGKAAS